VNKEDFAKREPELIGERPFLQYAVLAPLVETPKGISLLFEKRTHKLNSQPGEICFPGGKLEPNESLQACAVRETTEELQIKTQQIEILGPGDIFISPFNFMIHAFIGIIRNYQNTFSTDEVGEIIKVPLNFFRDNQPVQYKSKLIFEPADDFPFERIPGGEKYPWRNGTYDILFYHYNDHVIWGMTALITRSVLKMIEQYHLVGYDTM